MIDKNAPATKLLWVDLEMTGLDPAQDVILEVAAEVTDFDFKTLASYEAAVAQPDQKLNSMDEWCQEQHTKSGLLARIKSEGQPEDQVIADFGKFIDQNFNGEPAVLAGNSIHNDRIFIKSWWRDIDKRLHYRMLDVSSFKILMQSKYAVTFEKKEVHRAFDDIQASIAELQHYLGVLKNQ